MIVCGEALIGAILLFAAVRIGRAEFPRYNPFAVMSAALAFFVFAAITIRQSTAASGNVATPLGSIGGWAGTVIFAWLAIARYRTNPHANGWRLALVAAAFFAIAACLGLY